MNSPNHHGFGFRIVIRLSSPGRQFACVDMNLTPPHAGPAGTLDLHDPTVRIRREHTGTCRFAQPLHLPAQLTVLLFKFEDPRDSSQVDALFLTELLRLREAEDVPQGIPTGATLRALRYDQSKTIILTQRLRMHVRQLSGTTDREHRQFDVETDLVGTVQISPAGHDRDGAHCVQPASLLRYA